MAEFDFVVDTTPMAETVSSVSNHVTATTTAVVAMQAAVIASEKASANKICNNVDAGFHSLIRSQLSMKTSVAYTEMQAKLALLLKYSKTLRKTRDRMEADFSRVKRQYSQIFKGLDIIRTFVYNDWEGKATPRRVPERVENGKHPETV